MRDHIEDARISLMRHLERVTPSDPADREHLADAPAMQVRDGSTAGSTDGWPRDD